MGVSSSITDEIMKVAGVFRSLLRLYPKGTLCSRGHVRHLIVEHKGCPEITIKQARSQLKTLVGSAETFSAQRDESVFNIALAASQDELPVRHMMDSYCQAVIPIGSDPKLREKYVNFHNTVRFGRILEDLDTMSVWVSYTHNKDPTKPVDHKSPLSIVTACVDKIGVTEENILSERDLYLRGHVTYVGQSSLEVTIQVEQDHGDSVQDVMEAKFLMVARDPENVSKAYVNPLQPQNVEEEEIFKKGQGSKRERQQQMKESLMKTPPTEAERLIIHDMFLATLDERAATFKHPIRPEGSVWMEDSILKNIIICFPEKRNLYNKIFGGFLMRKAFELGWANACVYSKMRPFVLAVDDIVFRKPVSIGSLLYLSSQVVYTIGPHLQVKVHAEVINPKTGEHETTNTFYFTFMTKSDVPPVMPKSYSEYMMYVDGKRHYETSIGIYV